MCESLFLVSCVYICFLNRSGVFVPLMIGSGKRICVKERQKIHLAMYRCSKKIRSALDLSWVIRTFKEKARAVYSACKTVEFNCCSWLCLQRVVCFISPSQVVKKYFLCLWTFSQIELQKGIVATCSMEYSRSNGCITVIWDKDLQLYCPIERNGQSSAIY